MLIKHQWQLHFSGANELISIEKCFCHKICWADAKRDIHVISLWHHDMETLSTLTAFMRGINSLVDFPHKGWLYVKLWCFLAVELLVIRDAMTLMTNYCNANTLTMELQLSYTDSLNTSSVAQLFHMNISGLALGSCDFKSHFREIWKFCNYRPKKQHKMGLYMSNFSSPW